MIQYYNVLWQFWSSTSECIMKPRAEHVPLDTSVSYMFHFALPEQNIYTKAEIAVEEGGRLLSLSGRFPGGLESDAKSEFLMSVWLAVP